jgi:hypothetical protein
MPNNKERSIMEYTSPVLTEEMISQWLKAHRAEYGSATETIKACLVNFGLHRRHRKLVWSVYCRTDFTQ